ncbi:MAG: hypothetical protein ABJG88_03640, partial [Litorimonas sp.]
DLWDKVQACLKANAPKRRRSINIASTSLLTGLLYVDKGERLTPIHTRKPNGRRYCYYISARLAKGEVDDGTALRLPAPQIEGHVIRRLTDLLPNTARLMEVTGHQCLSPHQIKQLEKTASNLLRRLSSDNPKIQRLALIDSLKQITIGSDELTLTLIAPALYKDLNVKTDAGATKSDTKDTLIPLTYPLQIKRRGVETKLIIGGKALGQPDQQLIKLIAKSKSWYDGLTSGEFKSIGQIATLENIDNSDVSRALTLAFLSPTIIKDFIAGHHPVDLTVRDLLRKASRLPLNWDSQRRYLDMAA